MLKTEKKNVVIVIPYVMIKEENTLYGAYEWKWEC